MNLNNFTLQTIYADSNPERLNKDDFIKLVMSNNNIEYLTNLIIERADPLRNGTALQSSYNVRAQVIKYLESWKNLGKFDRETVSFEGKQLSLLTVSPTSLVDHYNLEFVKTFAESILPTPEVINVTSVVNPAGLYAQQERILKVNNKPVPFYEKAIYRRLTDRNLQQRIDETEMPFYRMDKNPRITDEERKKAEVDRNTLPTYFEREGPFFRMNPKY